MESDENSLRDIAKQFEKIIVAQVAERMEDHGDYQDRYHSILEWMQGRLETSKLQMESCKEEGYNLTTALHEGSHQLCKEFENFISYMGWKDE